MDDQVIGHLIDIKQRLSVIETKVDAHVELKEQVDSHALEIAEAKASLRTVKWIAGFLLVSVPASLAALSKVLKG